VLVASELLRVARRPAEDLAPPSQDVPPLLFADAARERPGEQIVGFDAVLEGGDHPGQCRFSPAHW
jgi:hypothetical protein